MRTHWSLYGALAVTTLGLLVGLSLFTAPGRAENEPPKSDTPPAVKPADVPPTKSIPNEPAKLAAGETKAPPVASEPDAYDRIMTKLEEPTTFDFRESTLAGIVSYIEKNHDLPIQIDRKALEEAGFDTATGFNKLIPKLPLKHALRLMFNDQSLAYVVENEVVCITTKTAMENRQITRVYPVEDLILSDNGERDPFAFVELIQSTVQPNTWKSNGGQGDCTFHRDRICVVMNTQDVHEQLQDLLAQLRRAASMNSAGKQANIPIDNDKLVRRIYRLRESAAQAGDVPANGVRKVRLTEPPEDVPVPLIDLITGDEGMIHLVQLGGLGASGGIPDPGPKQVSPEKLVVLVKQVVRPETWANPEALCLAGPAALIVVQTPEVQREVARFLQGLQVLRVQLDYGEFGSCKAPEGSAF